MSHIHSDPNEACDMDCFAEASLAEQYHSSRKQLLALALDNKRLREAYGKYAGHFTICKIFDGMTDGGDTTQPCDCGFEETEAFTDHSQLAGLYLELREKAKEMINATKSSLIPRLIMDLRDILKRIEDYGK